jgi:hypothetical protein
VFSLLCMFRSVYSDSFCCSVYCCYVNVYCTIATGVNPIAVKYISYHIISYHIIYHIMSYIISYHISYHIISYHIISYHNSLPTFRDKYRSHLKELVDSWTLKMWPVVCPETSVRNYRYSLRNSPEERNCLSVVHHGMLYKSLNYEQWFVVVNININTRGHTALSYILTSYCCTWGTQWYNDFTESTNRDLENSEKAAACDNELGALAICTEQCCHMDMCY